MTDDASLPPEVRRIPADPARALDAALAGVDSSQMKEGEGGEEFDVAPVPSAARDQALAVVAEGMDRGLFAPVDPEKVTRSLAQVQAIRSGAAKRSNVYSAMMAEAVVRNKGARGERYRRESFKEVLALGSALRQEATIIMQSTRQALELASVRGDDIGAVVKAEADVKDATVPDDPLSQEIFLRHKLRGPSGKKKADALHSVEAKERLRQEEDESDDAEGGE